MGTLYLILGTHNHRIVMNLIACLWTNIKKKPAISSGFRTSLDFIGLGPGGGGGSRTRVRKHSTGVSTCLAFVLNWRPATPEGGIHRALSCKVFALPAPGIRVRLSYLYDALIRFDRRSRENVAVLCG